MLNFLIICLIFLENSLVTTFPYNFIAIPYLTYLAYQKRNKGIIYGTAVVILISKDSVALMELGVIFLIIFIISYFISKILNYKESTIFYFSLLQFTIYGGYLYIKVPYFNPIQGFSLLFGYILVNYIFVKISGKKG